MVKKILNFFAIMVLFYPVTCFAQQITYNDAKISFSIDESAWTETSLTKERTYIDRKWTSDCGTIMTGTYDIYNEFSEDELEGVHRKYFNYKNLFNDNTFALSLLEEYKNTYSVDNWSFKNFNMKFINFSGSMQQSGINIDYDMYMTINNGYAFMIQYMKSDIVNKGSCSNPISSIVESAKSTIEVEKMEDNMSDSELIYTLIIGLALTFLCYEAYPFVRVVLMKKKYNEEEAKKMALWNSVVVGFIFLVLTVSTNENATWSAGPAFLYYWINRNLWVNKKGKSNPKKEKLEDKVEQIEEPEEEMFECDNCGALVKDSDVECPNCGASFTEDEEEEMFKCDNCGAMVPESATECPNCGELFEEETEEDLDQIYESAEKLKNSNRVKAKEKYNEYISKTEKIMKSKDEKCYTFGNCIEFSIAANSGELDEEACIDINYKTSDAYLNLAIISFDEKDYDNAIKLLNKSLKLNPCNISSMFEMAENYKAKGELNKYFNWTNKCYEKIYYVNHLAHYYRNLGYYYIEKKDWNLAKTLYLYSLKYDSNPVVNVELQYIIQKTNDKSLPKKEELTSILRKNDIPTFIKKENLNIIKELYNGLEKENKLDSYVGKFIINLMDENSNSK